jgi:hypothetical protein
MVQQIMRNAFGVLVVGAFVAVGLFAHVGDQPRLWDVLSERLAGNSSGPNGPNVIWVDAPRATTRMMVTADSSFAPQTAAAEASAPRKVSSTAPVARAPKSTWMRHISGMLAMFNITGPATEHSSASASAAPAPAGGAPASAPAAAAPAASVAAVAPGAPAAAASYVSYGSASRSDIMSSASGPVYNFSGNKR